MKELDSKTGMALAGALDAQAASTRCVGLLESASRSGWAWQPVGLSSRDAPTCCSAFLWGGYESGLAEGNEHLGLGYQAD